RRCPQIDPQILRALHHHRRRPPPSHRRRTPSNRSTCAVAPNHARAAAPSTELTAAANHSRSKPAAALHPDHCRPPSQPLQSGATEPPLQTTSGDHPPPPNVFPHHHPSRELPPRPGLLPTSFTREPSGDPSSTSSTPGSGASTLLASSSAFPWTALPSLLPCSNHENLTGFPKIHYLMEIWMIYKLLKVCKIYY
ncbi:protein FAM193B, partial [Triticum aestivum]|uniref:protein FAM193B n=1 Tax=Triticum aestivum TaxID=4565 RepID=UPI001D00FDD1